MQDLTLTHRVEKGAQRGLCRRTPVQATKDGSVSLLFALRCVATLQGPVTGLAWLVHIVRDRVSQGGIYKRHWER